MLREKVDKLTTVSAQIGYSQDNDDDDVVDNIDDLLATKAAWTAMHREVPPSALISRSAVSLALSPVAFPALSSMVSPALSLAASPALSSVTSLALSSAEFYALLCAPLSSVLLLPPSQTSMLLSGSFLAPSTVLPSASFSAPSAVLPSALSPALSTVLPSAPSSALSGSALSSAPSATTSSNLPEIGRANIPGEQGNKEGNESEKKSCHREKGTRKAFDLPYPPRRSWRQAATAGSKPKHVDSLAEVSLLVLVLCMH